MQEDVINKAVGFLQDVGYFFVASIDDGKPAVRPFGAVMEDGGVLYLATHDGNQAHRQMREDSALQVVCKREGSREWVRMSGAVVESEDTELKRRFLEQEPQLRDHYLSADDPHFLMFAFTPRAIEFKMAGQSVRPEEFPVSSVSQG